MFLCLLTICSLQNIILCHLKMTIRKTKILYENDVSSPENDIIENCHEDNLDKLEAEYDQYKQSEFESINYNKTDITPALTSTNINIQDSTNYIEPYISKFQNVHYKKYNNNNNNKLVISEYNETLVTEGDYFNHFLKKYFTLKTVGSYIKSLFPIVHWLPHYNTSWFTQDLIAGITVGCVLVPQSMSYAQLATLPPQYGLYSSFIGAFIYSLFATSKDVCIGPVAIMSLETAKVIAKVLEKYPENTIDAPIIASTLALLCGAISLTIGLLRLGFLVELISLNAVAGFMTGSALNIISGQVPSLMGYSDRVNTREATYKVIINSLKHLPNTKLDAVFGLIPLFILYFWKWWCNSMGPQMTDKYFSKDSKQNYLWKKFYFYTQACRNAFVIIIFTAISWSITHGKNVDNRPIEILGNVPKGLPDITSIKVPDGLIKNIAPELPASIIVLLLEHIAIAKSFGRVNDYQIIPDQELVAIGVTNLIGTVFHAYPATGSFSRSALKAKCNVKTPLSGLFSGACVIMAIYCLTSAFFYIPKATLSGVIIHAVSDLVANYTTTLNFYRMNPTDFIGFLVTIFITVFSSIEIGIYFSICWSCTILLYKIAFPTGQFLGRIEIAEVINANIISDDFVITSSDENSEGKDDYSDDKKLKTSSKINSSFTNSMDVFSLNKITYHTKWVPFNHKYTRELNGDLQILPPPPGVIVYRLNDSYTYINCSRHYDTIFDEVKRTTRRGQLLHHRMKSDRPWNDPGEWKPPKFFSKIFNCKKQNEGETNDLESNIIQGHKIQRDERPLLKIICLDFSQVSQVDATAIQSLVDLRKALNAYADRQVEFHFAGIISPWIKKSLKNFGFGDINKTYSDESIATGHISYYLAKVPRDLESSYEIRAATGTNLPFFHIDIPDFSKWGL